MKIFKRIFSHQPLERSRGSGLPAATAGWTQPLQTPHLLAAAALLALGCLLPCLTPGCTRSGSTARWLVLVLVDRAGAHAAWHAGEGGRETPQQTGWRAGGLVCKGKRCTYDRKEPHAAREPWFADPCPNACGQNKFSPVADQQNSLK